MQPLINLKAFVAVLVILAVPGAFFVAYFRGGPPEGDAAAQHGSAGHSHAGAGGMSRMSGMGGGGEETANRAEHGASGHGEKMNIAESSGEQAAAKDGNDHGMMNMASAPKPQSLYSVGGEGFFLDQPQLDLSTEQIQRLGQIRDRTMQGQGGAQQKIGQAEEALWKETSATKPVQVAITTQVREIERMRADMRLALILAVSEAVDVLSADQRKMIPGDNANSAKPAGVPTSTAPVHKDH
jgi:hypothetical protein